MSRHGSFDAMDEAFAVRSRLIKCYFATWPRNGAKGRCFTQRGEFPALRELTLIHLARGEVKQFDVNSAARNSLGNRRPHVFRPFRPVRRVLLKGPVGIFCKRDYIAHV